MIRYAILALLRDQSDYGYSLKRRFESHVGRAWQLNIGQIYQGLQELQQQDLIRPCRDEDEPRSGRRFFEITDAGRDKIERWQRRPPVRRALRREELLVKLLALGSQRSQEALRHVRHLMRLVDRDLEELAADCETGDWIQDLSRENARLHLEAEAAWLLRCSAAIEAIGRLELADDRWDARQLGP